MAAKSSNETEVLFDAPLTIEIEPIIKPLSLANNTQPSHDEMQECVRKCKANGFDERAIVVKRGQSWQCTRPNYFGVVSSVRAYSPMNDTYFPLEVQWFDSFLNNSTKTTKHFPEELWLIHEAIREDEILMNIREQKYMAGVP
jgi:hypothetical protein